MIRLYVIWGLRGRDIARASSNRAKGNRAKGNRAKGNRAKGNRATRAGVILRGRQATSQKATARNKTESPGGIYTMDTLPPELLNIIIGDDLVVFDCLRATSKSLAAVIAPLEPPILIDDMPINDTMFTGLHWNVTMDSIHRGNISIPPVITTVTNVLLVFGAAECAVAVRIFRGCPFTVPVFVPFWRKTGSTKRATACECSDPTRVMMNAYDKTIYEFDVNVYFNNHKNVFFHVSNVGSVFESGQWDLVA